MAALYQFAGLLLVVGLLTIQTMAQTGPQVTLPGIPSTTLRGNYYHFNETEYLNVDIMLEEYLGIPFAKPPEGDLRFKKPVKPDYLGQTYLAKSDKPVCAQLASIVMPDEDCLYLGVFTSSPRPSNAPVLVWIHGGAFTLGAGSQSVYKPYALLATAPDMVVVTINYRLGVFGYLTTGDSASPGNYGMFDQVMALEWVRDNIEAFGGDPSRVTIMGESAGSASVGLHLLSPLSGGLFSQSIMQSGNAASPWAVDTNIERQAGYTNDVAEYVNCTSSNNEAMMDCLRNADARQLLVAQERVILQNLVIELIFVPVVDNEFLTDSPGNLLERGEFHSVPSLTGTTQHEGSLFVFRVFPDLLVSDYYPIINFTYFREILPDYLYFSSPLLVAASEQWYIDWTQADNATANQLDQFVDLLTDQAFACPTELYARKLVASEAPVYRYEFTYYQGDGWYRAGHGNEIVYVFGRPLFPDNNYDDEEKHLSKEMVRYWTNFAQSGDPNSPLTNDDVPEWPRYTLPEQEYKVLSVTFENGRALRMDTCAFWLNYAPTLYYQDDEEELFQDWQQEYEEWRDVHMKEWEAEFEKYKDEGGCA